MGRILGSKRNKALVSGGLMILVGFASILQAASYRIGTLNNMGPGFFPVVLGAILVVLGLAIAVGARNAMPGGVYDLPSPGRRGWIFIPLSIMAFAILGKYGGLLPATFAIVFISAFADRRNTIKDALVLAIAITVVCIVIFWWALRIQFALLSWG